MKIGYARVSTKHQCGSLDEQIKVLKKLVAIMFIQMKDLINIISDLKGQGIGFCNLKEQMDTNTDIGMLLFNMICSISKSFRGFIFFFLSISKVPIIDRDGSLIFKMLTY